MVSSVESLGLVAGWLATGKLEEMYVGCAAR